MTRAGRASPRKSVGREACSKVLALGLALCCSCLVSCGGSKAPHYAVKVGDREISPAEVDHWANAIAIGDFALIGKLQAPRGMVAGASRAEVCGNFLEGLVGKTAKSSTPASRNPLPRSKINSKCDQLRSVLEREAVTFLASTETVTQELNELGVTVSRAEVTAKLNAFKKANFKSDVQFNEYLTQRGLSLTDEMLVIKKDVTSTDLINAVQKRFGTDEGALVTYVHHASAKWLKRTTCEPAYVVQYCREYRAKANQGTSAAVMIEEIGRLAGSLPPA